jgi:hypothetical protein
VLSNAIDQDVARPDVPVEDVGRMCCAEPARQLAADGSHLVCREATSTPEHRRQRTTGHESLGDEVPTLLAPAGVVDLHDALVRAETGERAGLTAGPLPCGRRVIRPREKADHHVPVVALIDRPPDVACLTFPDRGEVRVTVDHLVKRSRVRTASCP